MRALRCGGQRWILLLLVLVLIPSVRAAQLLLPPLPAVPQHTNLTGAAQLLLDQQPSAQATISAKVDSILPVSLPLPPSQPQLKSFPFRYNFSATGQSSWLVSPPQSFSYSIQVNGTCGNAGSQDCAGLCGPPYPCDWFADAGGFFGSVSADQGLKFIKDGSALFSPPPASNNDTYWRAITSAATVTLTFRAACGDETYKSYPVWHDGWVRRTIQPSEGAPIPGTFKRLILIEPFDNASLAQDRTAYGGGPGGIYRVQAGTAFLLSYGTDAVWFGSNGTVVLNSYDPDASYAITYLPPNGPRLCALTTVTSRTTSDWTVQATISPPAITADAPYNKTYTLAERNATLPAPACPVQACSRQYQSHAALKLDDPENAVALSFDPATLTVNATTARRDLAAAIAVTIPLRAFNLSSGSTGNHTLTLQYTSLQNTTSFFACADADRDGSCSTAEYGLDCNDNSAAVNPGATELCNGIDDDCNGQIDETFSTVDARIGSACGVPNSSCAGVWVCGASGAAAVCNAPHQPGELQPVCGSGQDNDCDGVVDDKQTKLENNKLVPLCPDLCRNGDTKPCGSKFGICKQGLQTCANGQWGACLGGIQPRQEQCNNQDDNCDSIVDNIGAAIGDFAPPGSACECANGAAPAAELCNGIDDDCNGQIDDGISCCTAGQTRACGLSVGVCQQGTERCANNQWEGVCRNSIQPAPELCDGLDNDCNNEVDDNCVPAPPGQPPAGWPFDPLVLTLLGGMALVAAALFLRWEKHRRAPQPLA